MYVFHLTVLSRPEFRARAAPSAVRARPGPVSSLAGLGVHLTRLPFTNLCRPRQVTAATLEALVVARSDPPPEERWLLVSLVFCLGEWCMRLPIDVLTETDQQGKSLLLRVFKVGPPPADVPQTGVWGGAAPRTPQMRPARGVYLH